MIKLALHISLAWLLFLLQLQTTKTQPFFLYQDCDGSRMFTSNSTYAQNLKTLLSQLAAAAGTTTIGFSSSTVGKSSSSPVYGVFFCRGDIGTETCSICVSYAIDDRARRSCQTQKTVFIGYEECMLHYTYQPIFSKLQLQPVYAIFDQNIPNVPNPKHFAHVLRDTVSRVIPRAVAGGRGKKFAVAKAPLSNLQSLYTLAQCTPDLSKADCNECLTRASTILPQGKQEGRVITPSCNIRFDVNQFYIEATAAWADASGNLSSVSASPQL